MSEDFSTRISEYKGHPILEIHNGRGKLISFGLRKAEAILASVEAIEGFVRGEAIAAAAESAAEEE